MGETKEITENQFQKNFFFRNSIYNLAGYSIPLVVAVIVFPLLIERLGEERFGLLSIVWIVIGYFNLFDFGISKALTQIVSENIGTKKNQDIAAIFGTSIFLMLVISVIIAICFAFLTPLLINDIFKVSAQFEDDSKNSFYVLAFTIPIVVTTAGLRGFLEAYSKFGIINILKIILGVTSFVLPLLCTFFTTGLYWIVVSLSVLRIIIWLLFWHQCLEIPIGIKLLRKVDLKRIKEIFKLSGWMTVSNTIVPIMVYLDRLLIGALVSAAALTYYVTPYEIISKLLIIPASVATVLFPTFSSLYSNDHGYIKSLLLKSSKLVFIIVFPMILIITVFANEILNLWLGQNFADQSTTILQFMGLGVMFNAVAFVPFTYLQSIKRPDIPAIINLIEFPFYIFFLWLSIKYWGILGAAFIWMIRLLLDSIIHIWIIKRKYLHELNFKFQQKHLIYGIFVVCGFFPLLLENIIVKISLTSLVVGIFLFSSWVYLLNNDEKKFFKLHTRILN